MNEINTFAQKNQINVHQIYNNHIFGCICKKKYVCKSQVVQLNLAFKKNDLPSTLTWTEHCAVFPEESVAVIRVVFTVPMSATVSRSTPVSEDVLDPCSTLLTKSRGSRVTMVASSGMRTVLDGLQDSKGGISSVIPTESEQLPGLPRVHKQLFV